MEKAELYLVVNRAIGKFPGFLFLPIPILCVLLAAFSMSMMLTLFLGLGMGAVLMMGMFLALTWLFAVGQDPVRFSYSLIPPPTWARGRCTITSVLERD